MDHDIDEIVASKRVQPMIASHPVYGYFARRYGLTIRSVLWEPDEMPSEEQWSELQNIFQDHPAKWMLWESEPSAEAAARLRSLEIRSLVFDPAGNIPKEGDFLSVMRQNVKNLRAAFQEP